MKVKTISFIVGIIVFFSVVEIIFRSSRNTSLIPILFGSIFGIAIVGVLVYWLFGVITRRAIGAPTIEVSSTTLRVGETFSVTCQQTFKRKVTVTGIKIELIRREIAKYSRGTDTETVTFDKIVQEVEEPGRIFNAGETFLSTKSWKIPPDEMHSFKNRNNSIKWMVTITIGVQGWRDISKSLPLTVLPEVFSE